MTSDMYVFIAQFYTPMYAIVRHSWWNKAENESAFQANINPIPVY